MTSQSFPDDSLDPVEDIYSEQILQTFPRYKEFWEKFIGTERARMGRLIPREMEVPGEWPDERREELELQREKAAMFHYSLFCDFAGAHYQLKLATEASNHDDPHRKYFEFFEAFDNFYGHLANADNHIECLWNAVRKIVPGVPELDEHLKNDQDLKDKHDEFVEEAVRVRDTLVHYARVLCFDLGGYKIPWPLPGDTPWSEYDLDETEDALKKMERDLELAEAWANAVDGELIPILTEHFEEEGVEVP